MKQIKHFIHRIAGWVYFKTMSIYSLEKSADEVRQLVVKDEDFKIQLSKSDVEAMGVKIIK